MRNVLIRLFLTGWLISMIGVAVWNGQAAAQGGGMQTLYLPMVHQDYDLTLHDYIGIVSVETSDSTIDLYTVRGDSSEWDLLINDISAYQYESQRIWVWSPDGSMVAYLDNVFTAEATVNLVTLSNRKSMVLYEAPSNSPLYWSPDSRYLTFSRTVDGMHTIKIYDVQTDVWDTIPVHTGEDYFFYYPIWAPDGHAFLWHERILTTGGTGHKITMWNGVGSEVHTIYEGGYGYRIAWSPDSTRVAFTGSVGFDYAVYITDETGNPPLVVLEGYFFNAWVEDGQRLLIGQDYNTRQYLVNPDGSMIRLFRDETFYGNELEISPGGRFAAYSNLYDGSYGAVVQRTDSLTDTEIPLCRGLNFTWAKNDRYFACDTNDSSDIGQQVILGNTDATPSMLRTLQDFRSPTFLPESSNYLALDATTSWYPASFRGTFLYNLQTDSFKQLQYPNHAIYRVVEWRYMP